MMENNMRNFIALLILLFAGGAFADTLNEGLADSGKTFTKTMRQGMVRFHSATGTVSLDNAVNVQDCINGLDIWFNPDFTGTDVTATYTLFNCPRKTASADFAAECLPANFDPDGGPADTNVMSDANNALHIWNMRVRFFGATITAGAFTAQAAIWCLR